MNCRRARRLLTSGREAEPLLARHLAGCPRCRRFAERWATLRQALRAHRAEARPDSGFTARVVARLDASADPWLWAARRLLPATLALTLVLTGWCLLRTPAPASVAELLAADDLLSWVAAGTEDGR